MQQDAQTPGPASAKHKLLETVRREAVIAYTSTWPRRLLPVAAAYKLIDAAAALAARSQARAWQENVRFHEQLLRYTPLRGTEREVATNAVAEFLRIMEIFWRPWLMQKGEAADIDNYRSVHSQGRPVLLAFPHFGLTYAAAPTLHRSGIDTYTVLSPHHHEATGDSYEARLARRARAYVDELGEGHNMAGAGGREIKAEGTFARMQELLLEGKTVAIAWSLPGSMPTPFLGRMLSLASGPAKLAAATDAVVVPFVNQRRGTTPILRFGAPIDSRDHGDAVAIQAAIAKQIEQWALQHPEAVWPLSTQRGGPPLIRGEAIAAEAPAQPAAS